MQRYKLTIEYQGTDYSGWQWQKDVPSVQQAIQDAIYGFCQQKVTVNAAGRTDAGVHARGQVAHIDLAPFKKPMDGFDIMKAINAHLRPQPICVLKVEEVASDFNARFDAINKLYRYRIISRPSMLALDKNLAWNFYRPLDVDAMHEAAQHLIGKHDFSTFRAAECQAKSPVRTLDRIEVSSFAYDSVGGEEIWIEAEAQSFLHHQMRNIVGTLHLVGEGKWRPDEVKTALEAKDRKAGGPTAPADGLYLMRIDYEK